MKKLKILTNGIWKENPIFVMMLGMCSSLAISTSLTNAIGMGMAVTAVTFTLYKSWCLYPFDCCQLYYSWSCRKLCE